MEVPSRRGGPSSSSNYPSSGLTAAQVVEILHSRGYGRPPASRRPAVDSSSAGSNSQTPTRTGVERPEVEERRSETGRAARAPKRLGTACVQWATDPRLDAFLLGERAKVLQSGSNKGWANHVLKRWNETPGLGPAPTVNAIKTRYTRLQRERRTENAPNTTGNYKTAQPSREAPEAAGRETEPKMPIKNEITNWMDQRLKGAVRQGPDLKGRRKLRYPKSVPENLKHTVRSWVAAQEENPVPPSWTRANQIMYVAGEALSRFTHQPRKATATQQDVEITRQKLAQTSKKVSQITSELKRRKNGTMESNRLKRRLPALQAVAGSLKTPALQGALEKLRMELSALKLRLAKAKKRLQREGQGPNLVHYGSRHLYNEGDLTNIERFWTTQFGNGTLPIESSLTDLNVSQEELDRALARIRPYTAAGPDGLLGAHWKYIGHKPTLLRLCREAISGECAIPRTVRRGRTILIPKSDNVRDPANHRPITCLNVMFKIYTAVLTAKVNAQVVLPEEQRAVRKGARGTLDCHLVDEAVCSDAVSRKRDLSVAYIDFRKAFDSVEYDLLEQRLIALGCDHQLKEVVMNAVRGRETVFEVRTDRGERRTAPVALRRGLLQGDALSPVLFGVAVSGISARLGEFPKIETTNARFPNHLFFMDDLKLFARSKQVLLTMTEAVKEAAGIAGLEFGINKCAEIDVRRGQVVHEATSFPEHHEPYRYLGIKQWLRNDALSAVTEAADKFKRKVKSACAEVNTLAKFRTVYNTQAVSILSYVAQFGLLNVSTANGLDLSARQVMRNHKILQKMQNVDRLYMPTDIGGVGLKSVADMAVRSTVASAAYVLEGQTQLFAELAREYHARDNSLGKLRTSIVHKAKVLIRELGLTIDDPHVSYRTKMALVDRRKERLATFPTLRTLADTDPASFEWLKEGRLDTRCTMLVLAAQENRLTNIRKFANQTVGGVSPKCRVCGEADETIGHIVAACSQNRMTTILSRHEEVASVLYRAACKEHGLKLCVHNGRPQSVSNESGAVLYDERFDAHAASHTHRRPDLVIIDKIKRSVTVVEIGIALPKLLEARQEDKTQRYARLAKDMAIARGVEDGSRWSSASHGVVLGTFGEMTPNTRRNLRKLFGSRAGNISRAAQRVAVLGTLRILKNHLAKTDE